MTRALSSEATLYKEIIEEAKKNKKLFFNESTVGASLPIISTLKGLESDLRDNLNGLDVARKVIILSRITGMNLSLDTLPVENIVPEPL
ncbi:2267_t:CDS:2, partial [Scutellospora calospora]